MTGRHRRPRTRDEWRGPGAVVGSTDGLADADVADVADAADAHAADAHAADEGVATEALSVRFGELSALVDVTMSAVRGELVAVSGPSGAGKTTLLWALAGALDPAAAVSGRVTVLGEAIDPRGARERTVPLGVAMIPQGNGLAAVLTAAENCLVPLVDGGVPAREARARVAQALEAVGLQDSGNHLVEELSGGQQQRVAVARAIAARPTVLLADEPTSELDHANRERVLALLTGLASRGACVVMATNDPEAAAGAHRGIVLDAGRGTARA